MPKVVHAGVDAESGVREIQRHEDARVSDQAAKRSVRTQLVDRSLLRSGEKVRLHATRENDWGKATV